MLRALAGLLTFLSFATAAEEFRAAAIRGHMHFLASDLLEGRATGTRGYDIAAVYVAAQFESAGVLPGAGSSYFQRVPLRATLPDERSTMTLQPDSGPPLLLRFGEGFVTSGDPLTTEHAVTGRVVVAGYGVTAPELNHDDYAPVDTRGKIVLIFSGAPARFEGTLRAHYSSSSSKLENAARHGAAGVITIDLRDIEDGIPWSRVVSRHKHGTMHWVDVTGTPRGLSSNVSYSLTLNPDVADMLLAGSGKSLRNIVAAVKDGSFRSFELPARAEIRTISSHRELESANVAGLVRGSDPTLRDEYLVYSSHLDHVGITDPIDGDAINNGAFDNASGTSALLEIARATAAARPPPRRSILFVATTAEEKGLRGADYFANQPTVPAHAIVANINIDQIMMIDAVRDVIVHGIDASSLGDAARTVSQRTGIIISPDPFPEQVVFVRSDQYPFIKRGIPALYIDAGYTAVDRAIDARRNRQIWMRRRYHTPQDDLQQRLDYSVPAMVARFAFLVGMEIAADDARPAWKPGNFFGQTFARNR